MEKLTVLIPTDFSELSKLAVEMAQVLGRKIPLQIHLLHVLQVNDSDPEYLEGHAEAELEQRRSEVQKQMEILSSALPDARGHILRGKLTDQINKAAADLGADLVLMGTGGSGGFMELISGSEAQHVARYLEVPVLTIRPGTPMLDLNHILLVADFGHPGEAVQTGTIKKLAQAFNSTIHLLQILTEKDEMDAPGIESNMRLFAEEHRLERFEIHLHHDRKVAEGVRNFNREAQMDLVCIRTHGRKNISHFLFGSIAERLVNHCIKPLLTFKINSDHA